MVIENAKPLACLKARWHPALYHAIQQRERLIHELMGAFNSPLHFVCPEIFIENARAMQSVLQREEVKGFLFFAKKANKARCFAQASADAGMGMDVASVGEMQEALVAGVCGEAISISGPAKPAELLRLGLFHRSLIAVDSLDELERLISLARLYQRAARLVIRLAPHPPLLSRFGMQDEVVTAALARCVSVCDQVMLEGFSFHLAGYSAQERCDHAGMALRWLETARYHGLRPNSINIGGGFAVSYVERSSWENFLSVKTKDDFHAQKQFEGFYPYYNAMAGAEILAAILQGTPAGQHESLATLLRRLRVTVLLEPGRALLDQAGFTSFMVQGTKEHEDYDILTVNGTSFSLSEQWFNSEFLPDPLLLPALPAPFEMGAVPLTYRACVGGASCLDSDMVSWRKIVFNQRPRSGDLLIYPNTAGYQMDSNESPFHELPLPPKIVLRLDDSQPVWRVDRVS